MGRLQNTSSLQRWRLRLLAISLLAPVVGCWLYHPVTGIFPIEEESEEEKALLLGLLAISGASPGPEISIRQGATQIASGGAYTFTTSTHIFTIENSGAAVLQLGTMTNSNPGSFTLTPPAAATIAPGASADFTVQNPIFVFDTTVVTVPSNDADESNYTLNFTGCGC